MMKQSEVLDNIIESLTELLNRIDILENYIHKHETRLLELEEPLLERIKRESSKPIPCILPNP